MTAPNHIAAGLFFSGFWTSFWNINIFQKPQYIAVAIVSSLLADIDYTRSAMGLTFFPLARWLDKRFGHRTITHSLIFLLFSTLAVLFIEKYFLPEDWIGITVIFFFGALSHLIIDMVTVIGVPLLYPFRRNACVIPGRSKYRMQTGHVKSEITAFLIFCSLNFFCIDLYRQGFWFTYNNTFPTIEHVHFERANSPNFTLCRYYFIQQGQEFRGLAPIVNSKESELELLINGKVVTLDYSTPGLVLKSVNPVKTNFPFKYHKQSFYSETENNINRFCYNRIVTGNIQSNEAFILHFYKPDLNGTEETKKTTSLDLVNFTHVSISIPARPKTDKSNIEKQIAIKKQSLVQDKINFRKTHAEYHALKQQEQTLKAQLKSVSDLATKNSLENELIRIINRLQFMPAPVYTDNTVTLETINQLTMELNQKDSVNQYFNATLSYLDVPDSLIKISKK